MKTLTSYVAVLSLAASFSVHAAQPVDVSLKLEPDVTLPGLPVGVVVEVKNATTVEINVPLRAKLLVTPEDGEQFVALFEGESDIGILRELDETSDEPPLLPGKQATFAAPLIPGTGPEWFADRRLSVPGTYRLQMVITGRDDELNPGYYSNVVTLRVAEPDGTDADVRRHLQSITEGQGWGTNDWREHGKEVAAVIWSQFETSAYVQHVVEFLPYDGDRMSLLRRAIAVDPASVAADFIRMQLVGLLLQQSQACIGRGRPDERCSKYRRTASAELDRIAERSRSDVFRHFAKREKRIMAEQ